MILPHRLFIAATFVLLCCPDEPYSATLDVPFLIGRINDYAEVITNERERVLEEKLETFEVQYGAQIAVLTIASLTGENLEDYSRRVASKWKLGRRDIDDGVLLTVVRDDQKIRIEVGLGLEETLTNKLSAQILNELVLPHLRLGDYTSAVEVGLEAIMSALQGGSPVGSPSSEDELQWVKRVAGILVPGGMLGELRHGTYPSIQDRQGRDRTHLGVDVLAQCGTPIFSSIDYVVVDVINSQAHRLWEALGYGVMLRPSDSQQRASGPKFIILLHLESPPFVRVGEKVVAWQTEIGRIGRTGAVIGSGCHTHLEVRHFDSWLYPPWGNIYGLADVTSSSEYFDNWTDPESSEPLRSDPGKFAFSENGQYVFHYVSKGRETLLCVASLKNERSDCLGGIVFDKGRESRFYALSRLGSPKSLSPDEVVFLADVTPVIYSSPCAVLFASRRDGSGLRQITGCLQPQAVTGFDLASDPIRGWVAVYQQDGSTLSSNITIFDSSGSREAQIPFDLQDCQAGSMVFLRTAPKLVASIFNYSAQTLSIYEIDIHSGHREELAQFNQGTHDFRDTNLTISRDDRLVAYLAPTGVQAVNDLFPLEQFEIFLLDRTQPLVRSRQLTHNSRFERSFDFLPGEEGLLVALGDVGLQVLNLHDKTMHPLHGFDVADLTVSHESKKVALQIIFDRRDKGSVMRPIDLAVMNPDGSDLRSVLASNP